MTTSKMMSLMWEKSVFNSFKCSSSREEYLHVSRDGWEQYSTEADEILCFLPRFQEQSQEATLCSPTTCEAGRCSLSPKLCYSLCFLAVTPLLHCCIQPTASSLHLPGPSLHGRASAQPAGLSGIPVWHCSHFFSFHRVWAREGSRKDSCLLLSRSEGLFLPSLLYSWGGAPTWEQSECTPNFRALHRAGESNEHLAGVLKNSHFHRLESVPNFRLNNNVWEDPKCCAFVLH